MSFCIRTELEILILKNSSQVLDQRLMDPLFLHTIPEIYFSDTFIMLLKVRKFILLKFILYLCC